MPFEFNVMLVTYLPDFAHNNPTCIGLHSYISML